MVSSPRKIHTQHGASEKDNDIRKRTKYRVSLEYQQQLAVPANRCHQHNPYAKNSTIVITKSNASQTRMVVVFLLLLLRCFVILCQMLQMEIVAKVHAHKRSQHAVEHSRTNTRLLAKIKRVRLYSSFKYFGSECAGEREGGECKRWNRCSVCALNSIQCAFICSF